MNNYSIADALGGIDDDFISEAIPAEKKRKNVSVKKITVVLAAALIVIISAVPVLAANDVEPAYDLLYSVSPEFAQKLKPVKKSCVSNGIQIEVDSAKIYGDRAEILIAVKDIEQHRLDETIDLFDSYNIRGLKDSMGTCRLESFDKETETAVFMIFIQQMNGKKIDIDKVTFSVSEMLSNKKDFNGIIDSFDLSKTGKNPQTVSGKKLNFRGGIFDKKSDLVLLKPRQKNLCTLADGAYISAAGYFDGQLHIQAYYENICETDNHGFIYIQKENGEKIDCIINNTFWDDERKGSYEEYVFDIPLDELCSCRLYGEITTCDTLIKGEWEITFSVNDVK